MSVRAEQKEKRRAEILEAALDQFIRRGYAATKIKDIAEKAGMSVGLLFHYFDSKEELFVALMELGVSAPQTMLQGMEQMEPLALCTLCAEQVLRFAASSVFTAKMFVLMGSAYYSEGIPERARTMALSVNFYRDFVPVIQRGQATGTIRRGDPLALSLLFWTALQGPIAAFALNPELPLPEAEWIVDLVRAKEDKR